MKFISSKSESSPVTVSLDDVTFQLQESHDFEWLRSLGHVFCVFDEQDSGNICFGIENNGQKRFVKYAGSRPIDFSGAPQDAVARLQKAIPLYNHLRHSNLITLVDYFQTGHGYAAVFKWFEGECLHSHWSFPPPAKYTHPESPYYRYKNLPIEKRLESLDVILSFHSFVESKGYVAVDFYDGSILYDFSNGITKICDIDFYRKAPTINDMGEKFWGSSRSKSPEEFNLGSPIDARTNVFTMGAIAFGILGGEMDHSFSKWEAGKQLYDVALHAVSKKRELRFESVNAFKKAWNQAKVD
ncbi:serine/threonine protein kinase [Halobacillus amylolyticus]|uniref:Serine/threonine protein kinase n=1 Tax=Halobacillus amylolyticus TaxID=2932259 RepID=A0ABY4HEK2_9BACI|nr:serine/threonine protein kinase [Halobacillus amylolyticus]UOR12837.1 serine/threonine protein kinase [Halobacillus amylolyticus]